MKHHKTKPDIINTYSKRINEYRQVRELRLKRRLDNHRKEIKTEKLSRMKLKRIIELSTYISTNNIPELYELIYAGAILV